MNFCVDRLVTEYLSSAQSNQCFLAGSSFDLFQRLLMANCEAEAQRKRGKSGHLRQKKQSKILETDEGNVWQISQFCS